MHSTEVDSTKIMSGVKLLSILPLVFFNFSYQIFVSVAGVADGSGILQEFGMPITKADSFTDCQCTRSFPLHFSTIFFPVELFQNS